MDGPERVGSWLSGGGGVSVSSSIELGEDGGQGGGGAESGAAWVANARLGDVVLAVAELSPAPDGWHALLIGRSEHRPSENPGAIPTVQKAQRPAMTPDLRPAVVRPHTPGYSAAAPQPRGRAMAGVVVVRRRESAAAVAAQRAHRTSVQGCAVVQGLDLACRVCPSSWAAQRGQRQNAPRSRCHSLTQGERKCPMR